MIRLNWTFTGPSTFDNSSEQEILDLSQRKRITDVHHHREADHLGRTVEITEGILHPRRLRNTIPRLKPICSDKARFRMVPQPPLDRRPKTEEGTIPSPCPKASGTSCKPTNPSGNCRSSRTALPSRSRCCCSMMLPRSPRQRSPANGIHMTSSNGGADKPLPRNDKETTCPMR